MRLPPWILLASLLSPPAHAQEDWLAGEYEIVVPARPAPMRFVLVITRDADGRYRDEVFKETADASTGSVLTRIEPSPAGAIAGVREMPPGDIEAMKEPALTRANLRCAEVDGMLLCRIPEGASLDFGDRTLGPGYFASAMHVGLIDVHRRPTGAEPRLPSRDPRERP
jgi:hypothetical protein